MNNLEEIKNLEEQIRHHNDLYWNGKETEISDVEYDKLIERLKALDPENELVTEFAKPDVAEDKLVKHSTPMLSLGKIYTAEDLFKWVAKVSRSDDEQFLIQPKYDGMSGLLENGKLSSRGDGIYGQDYTDKLKIVTFDTNKAHIDISTSTLLGELVISNHDFNTIYKGINGKSGAAFKNQRNGIAGILGTDDVDFYANQGARITFVDYDVESWHVMKKDFEAQWPAVIKYLVTTAKYPLDGIVIKLADAEYSKSLGCTTHHPRGQVAYKFTNQSATSKLIDIEWGMGKKQLSAIGIIEPVEISGITIKRVKLQLTKPKNSAVETCLIDGSLQIGDNVVVERAGDIIPHIISTSPGENRTRVTLEKCPFCGGKLKIEETSVSCTNPECKELKAQEIYNSIVTLGVKNVGEKYIKMIVEDPSLTVNNIYDLMTLTADQLKLKTYGTRKKEIFFNEMEKIKKNATKEQFLASLNINNVGRAVAKIIVENFNWNDIINNNIDYNKLAGTDGIGSIISESVQNGMNKYAAILSKYNGLFTFKETPKKTVETATTTENANEGKTICFTGKMGHTRSEMENIARERGFVPVDRVGKDLDILVCADPSSTSSKLKNAEKYGIRIISEADFMNDNF